MEKPTLIGTYACEPATYPVPFNLTIPGNFRFYLVGETGPATIYNYGIPIANGLVGGWAAYPFDFPKNIKTFSLMKPGPMYVISADCDSPKQSNYSGRATTLGLVNITSYEHEFKSRVQVIYPAGSHLFEVFKDSAISQYCDVRLQTGEANIMMQFEVFCF